MSAINGIVDLIRRVLYDILGLFLPGAALILISRYSSTPVLHDLAELLSGKQDTMSIQLGIFIGASYVLGYAIQGIVSTAWPLLIRRRQKANAEANGNIHQKAGGGVSPAGRQVREEIQQTEVFQALRLQLGEYCKVNSEKLTVSEVQNLAFSISGDQSDNAFRFSFRADLCAGMFIVCLLGVLITIIEAFFGPMRWGVLLVYGFTSIPFYWRAKFYYNIRGRIIYSIALVVLADLRWHKSDQPRESLSGTIANWLKSTSSHNVEEK